MNRFAFFYLMKDDPERIREIVPRHIEYWHDLGLPDYQGGPFLDRSGGLITFSARGVVEANKIVLNDPFVKAGVLAEQHLKQWIIEKD